MCRKGVAALHFLHILCCSLIPHVISSLDWMSHSWRCLLEHKPSLKVQGTFEMGWCSGTGLGTGTEAFLQHPRPHWALWCTSWKKFGTIRTPTRPGCLVNLNNLGRRTLVWWPEPWRSLWELHVLWREKNHPEGRPCLQHSSSQTCKVL